MKSEQTWCSLDELQEESFVDLAEVQIRQAEFLQCLEVLEGFAEVRKWEIRNELQIECFESPLAGHVEQGFSEVLVPDIC